MPIVIAIIIIVLLQSFANAVTAIKPAKSVSKIAIAPRACFIPSGLTWLRTTITPVKISNAPDIIKSIAPACAAFFPANLLAIITAENTNIICDTAFNDFLISPAFIFASIFIEPTTNISAADIARIPTPACAAFLPANLLATITPAKIPNITAIVLRLSSTFAKSRLAISSNTPMNNFKAITIANTDTAEPNLIFLQAILNIANPANAPIIIFIV